MVACTPTGADTMAVAFIPAGRGKRTFYATVYVFDSLGRNYSLTSPGATIFERPVAIKPPSHPAHARLSPTCSLFAAEWLPFGVDMACTATDYVHRITDTNGLAVGSSSLRDSASAACRSACAANCSQDPPPPSLHPAALSL